MRSRARLCCHAAEHKRRSLSTRAYTQDSLELLPQFEWPGNGRELRNLVLKLGILNRQSEITSEDVRK